MTGSLSAATFSATLVPDGSFINNGSKFWLALIDTRGQGYFHSGAQGGWVPYRGGVAPAYADISAPSISVGFTQWDVSTSIGSQIYIAYGSSFEEMLSSGRFLLIHTIQGPAPDPLASNSGPYTCYNSVGLSRRVTLSLSRERAVVDVTNLYDIPYTTYDLPFRNIDSDQVSYQYFTAGFPFKWVSFDPTPGKAFPLAVAYKINQFGVTRTWVCQR